MMSSKMKRNGFLLLYIGCLLWGTAPIFILSDSNGFAPFILILIGTVFMIFGVGVIFEEVSE